MLWEFQLAVHDNIMNVVRSACASLWPQWNWVMESAGDEKRIRALFSEQRFADEQTAPGFNVVWLNAQSRAFKPRRAFNLSFAVATALLVFVLATLAIWSRFSQPAAPASAFANVPAGTALAVRPIKRDEPQPTGRENVAGTLAEVKHNRPRVRPGASSLSAE